jgi:hypothetical protein
MSNMPDTSLAHLTIVALNVKLFAILKSLPLAGFLINAPVGRHPGQKMAHSSTAEGRGFLLPG